MASSDALMARFLALHPRTIDLSLGRIERLLSRLNHPERRLPPVIHVDGTNGKGSTIAFMRAILEAGGLAAHVYTSPHLVRFHERIRIGGIGGGYLSAQLGFIGGDQRRDKGVLRVSLAVDGVLLERRRVLRALRRVLARVLPGAVRGVVIWRSHSSTMPHETT